MIFSVSFSATICLVFMSKMEIVCFVDSDRHKEIIKYCRNVASPLMPEVCVNGT